MDLSNKKYTYATMEASSQKLWDKSHVNIQKYNHNQLKSPIL